MSLDELNGLRLEMQRARIAPEKVAEYVAATGDDPDRWQQVAPPAYAGALLFMAAPQFLERDDVRAHTKVLVHVDQRFVWHGPLPIGAELALESRVAKVRSRGTATFATFEMSGAAAAEPVLESTSTFLLGEEPAAEPGIDPGEPPATQRANNQIPSRIDPGGAASALPALAKSASRVDLVRYAGASGDFNPIHYDHEAARGAGLDGIVVHGLLMGAWMAQLAASTSMRPDPISELRLRFRTALRPGVAATVVGTVGRDVVGHIDLALRAEEVELVTGHATVRSE